MRFICQVLLSLYGLIFPQWMFHDNWLICKKTSRVNNFILAPYWLHIIQNILPEILLLLGKGDISSDESLNNSWPSQYSWWFFCSSGNGGKCSEHGKHAEFKDKYSAALQESYDSNFLTGWIKLFCQVRKENGVWAHIDLPYTTNTG